MNKNGQVLVLFVMLLPLFFLLICLIVDIGFGYSEKNKIQNVIKEAIKEELNCEDCLLQDSKIRITSVINKNIENVHIKNIEVNDNFIKVSISKKVKINFFGLFNKSSYQLDISYKGYKIDDQVIIKKE